MADLAALRALLDESDDEGEARPPRPVTPVQAPPPQPAPPPPPQLGPPPTAPPRRAPPRTTAAPRAPRAPPGRNDDYTVVTTESGRKPQRPTRKRPAQPGGGPQKTCPACDAKVPLRKARCDCGHVFVSKKKTPPPPPPSGSDGVFDEAAATRDAKKLKVSELRATLEAAGADTEGLKADLVERLVAARRAAFYAPPPPPSDSDSDEVIVDDAARQEASLEALRAMLAESDDDDVPAPAPKTKKQKKQARPPAGGVPKPRGRAPAGAPPPAAAADTSALGATLASALDGMVRTGDLSREQAAAVLREYGRLAPAGAPLDRRRVKDRLVGKIEKMFAEAPRTSKKERYALARLEREAKYVEEGPRLADYGIDGASGLELGNPLGLED